MIVRVHQTVGLFGAYIEGGLQGFSPGQLDNLISALSQARRFIQGADEVQPDPLVLDPVEDVSPKGDQNEV